ncbi:MAG: hypothetical protein HOG79_16565, partial [Prolixibacteraceae bacterium]|nr:hypothetical protein [Prolixibacteraceae bacterium]
IPGFSSPLPDPPPLKPTILADNGNNQDYYADSGEPLIRIKSIEIKWRDENEDPKYMCSSSPAVIITVINRSNKKYVSNQSVTLLGNMSATTEKKTKEYILKARMNNVSIDYDNCTWEFIEEEIRFVMENHSIPSLEPYEETTFSASINPLIPKFDIGAELIEWDYTQNQNNPKERVSDGLFKEFKRSGPDISYDKGQTRVIFKEGFDNGKVVGTGKLKVQVTNMGDKATTGEITVELNFKQKKSEENEIAPKWVIKIPALQAGETRGNFNEEGVECVIIGDPNWDECWIHVSWTCPLGIGGMDIDYRNNFIHKTTSKQRF